MLLHSSPYVVKTIKHMMSSAVPVLFTNVKYVVLCNNVHLYMYNIIKRDDNVDLVRS